MAEKKRSKQKRQKDEGEKATKEEYEVAKFLRFNIPSKDGKLMGMEVKYFIASKAVDALLESKWSATKKKDDALFVSRSSCVSYCNTLLQKGIFHRAVRVEKTKDRDKKKKKLKDVTADGDDTSKDTEKSTKKDKKTKRGKDGLSDEGDMEESAKKESEKKESEKETEKKEADKKEEEKKKKRKVRLEMAEPQLFMDGDEVYVWIYDPMPLKSKIIGLLIVVGAVAVCLFPLWPPEVRLGVYYLSLAAAAFVGLILSLCVVQRVLFLLIWAVTLGFHHFWLLPNLTEDVSFFDSFRPLYQHTKKMKDAVSATAESVKRDSDEAEDGGEENGAENRAENRAENGADNGYEMVEADEVDDSHIEEIESETKKSK